MTRPTWYRPDGGLMARMLLTIVLLLAMYAGFVWILGFFTHSFVLFFVIALVLAGAQFFFSDKIALLSMNAREVTPQQAPDLSAMLERLAQQANLPTPKLYIADTSVPNAFATGRNERNAVVCVTTGILNRLTGPELEAVLAHELTHIINRDILIMTVATFFGMVAQLILRSFMWMGFYGGFGDRRGGRDNSGYAAIIALLASVVVAVVSFFLTRALSRYREYAADRGSALITGSPGNLASALMKISNSMSGVGGRIPEKDLREAQPASALMIAPLAVRDDDDFGEIFSTHPSTRHRIEKLMAMQRQMEEAPRLH